MSVTLTPALLPVRSGDPAGWAAAHRTEVRAALEAHGAVLVRGLPVHDRDAAARVSQALVGTPMVEREGFAPRDPLPHGVYTSTRWPADQPMCMHHELSHAAVVPGTLVLTCLTAPATGGATALADARAVHDDLPAGLRDRFARLGWQLVRSYSDLLGVSLTDAFGTGDRAVITDYCRANAVEARWDEDGTLHTVQHRPAVLRHPGTGEPCWFNQIAFLNEWTMDPAVREYLVSEFGAGRLPFTTRYGDGTPIDAGTVEAINEVYERHTVSRPWQAGDVLVVDNLRMAHSRLPYTGEREIVVALGDPVRPPLTPVA